MASLRQFFLRIAALFRSNRSERELTREIDSHLSLLEMSSSQRAWRRPTRSSRRGEHSAARSGEGTTAGCSIVSLDCRSSAGRGLCASVR